MQDAVVGSGLMLAFRMLAGVAIVLTGMVLGSLISAIWLRLAGLWLRFGKIPYLRAFECVLASNLAVFAFSFSIGVNYSVLRAFFDELKAKDWARTADVLGYSFSPMYLLYVTIFGLLVTAAIVGRMIPNRSDGSRVAYSDALALASVHYAISFLFFVIVGLFAYCAVIGLLNTMGFLA